MLLLSSLTAFSTHAPVAEAVLGWPGLVAERQEARAAKDFAKSDALRDKLHEMGVEIRDTPQGVVWDLL